LEGERSRGSAIRIAGGRSRGSGVRRVGTLVDADGRIEVRAGDPGRSADWTASGVPWGDPLPLQGSRFLASFLRHVNGSPEPRLA